jgi:myo-inositol-1-phosphate synthase
MITKLISSKSVIAKIIADLDLKENEIKITDYFEWIAEGMEKIGAVTQLEPKVKTVEIHNHQSQIPCDLHQLHQVAYSFNCDVFPK